LEPVAWEHRLKLATWWIHGLDNVFIADASIIPKIPRANTNSTCLVIGARAADFLAYQRG
jgi:choline dehydrogenase-like flavoprotein